MLIPSGVIFSLQTILTCICGKMLFALFDKLLCERVCTKWKKTAGKNAESYSTAYLSDIFIV